MTGPSNLAARSRFTRVENERLAASGAAGPAVQSRGRPAAILVLRVRGRIVVVDEASIDWIDGAGN